MPLRGFFKKAHDSVKRETRWQHEWETSTFCKVKRTHGKVKVDLARTDWDGFYLLGWLLTHKPMSLLSPGKAQHKGVKIETETWGWNRRESDLSKKNPIMWSTQVITPISSLQEIGDLVFGEMVGKKLSKRYKDFLNAKVMSFWTDDPWVPCVRNEIAPRNFRTSGKM